MERGVLPWRIVLCRLHAVRHIRGHLGEVRFQRFAALRLRGVDLAGQCHHAELLAEQDQVSVHGCRRAPGRAVLFTPAHVVVDQRGEPLFVEVRPTPRNGGHRVAGRPLRQKQRRVVALAVPTTEPELRRHAEVPATATGVRPPQVTMRIVLVSHRGHRLRLAALVDHDGFHRVQVIGDLAVQPRQRAEAAAGHVPSHAYAGTDTSWQGHAPAHVQRSVHATERRPCFHGECTPKAVVVDRIHLAEVDHAPDGGIVDEPLRAVAATAHRELLSGCNGRLYRIHHLVRAVHDEHAGRCADEASVVPA